MTAAPPRILVVEALRAGRPLDIESRKLLIDMLSAVPQRSVGAQRLALQAQGWSIARIARAAGKTREAVKQSLRRERRRLEREANG